MTALVASYPSQGKDRYADQEFLRRYIWPIIRCASQHSAETIIDAPRPNVRLSRLRASTALR